MKLGLYLRGGGGRLHSLVAHRNQPLQTGLLMLRTVAVRAERVTHPQHAQQASAGLPGEVYVRSDCFPG